jgi:hypothetical protein
LSTSTQRIEEGFRVLTLRYPITEDIKEFIEEYRALASHFYWCKRLGLEPSKEVVERLWQRVPSYWRWQLVDPKTLCIYSKALRRCTCLTEPLLDCHLWTLFTRGRGRI